MAVGFLAFVFAFMLSGEYYFRFALHFNSLFLPNIEDNVVLSVGGVNLGKLIFLIFFIFS